MTRDSNRVFVMVFGKTMNSHKNFMEKLLDSRKVCEVFTENEADFIIAFVSIVSRIGTDIEAAMKMIPASKPVVLVVLHHTFEPDYNIPDSRRHVQRDNVFTVDCLFYEDQGLLECQRNKGAIKAVQKHLEAKTSRANIKELTNTDAVSEQRAPLLNYSNSKNRGMPNTDVESARWAQLPDHNNVQGVTYPDPAFAQHTPLLAHNDDEHGGMPNTDVQLARWTQLPDLKNIQGMPITDMELARRAQFPDHNNARNHKKNIIFVVLGILILGWLKIVISYLIRFT